MSDSTETTRLLTACELGNEEGFELLFARHRRALRAFISRRLGPVLTTRIDASDIVQDTQAAMFTRLEDYFERRPMPFQVWAMKTALDCLGKARRHHVLADKRSILHEVPLSHATSVTLADSLLGSPSASLNRKEQVARVRLAMDELGDSDREILVMRYVEGLNNVQIGSILELSPDAVSKRHGRALVRLHQLLGQD
ncbi:MAG: sigma-70 family RNA polymerase sigma factor [Planctomycetales bacterium]|nr:sigma-70 family RNA polymerase sigma factor [Planctomycetales bacterium]